MNKLFAFTLEAIIVMVFIGIIASLTIQNLGYNENLKKRNNSYQKFVCKFNRCLV